MHNISRVLLCALAIGGLIAAPAQALSLGVGPVGIDIGGGGTTTVSAGGGTTPGITTTIDLLGSETSVGANSNGTNSTGHVSTGLGGLLDDLFGPSRTSPVPGGNGGGGTSGGVLSASLGPAAQACFLPDAKQMGKLLRRHTYSSSSVRGVTSVEIIKIPLCPAARVQLAQAITASMNLQRLHNAIEDREAVHMWLRDAGYSIDDVIAVDKSGKKLVIYVI